MSKNKLQMSIKGVRSKNMFDDCCCISTLNIGIMAQIFSWFVSLMKFFSRQVLTSFNYILGNRLVLIAFNFLVITIKFSIQLTTEILYRILKEYAVKSQVGKKFKHTSTSKVFAYLSKKKFEFKTFMACSFNFRKISAVDRKFPDLV